MPKVTVVIPVFNSEKYIRRCAVSLMEQTLDEVEYVFVDDGSTDDTSSIIRDVVEEYPHRSELVRLISRENRGVGASRKQGILQASGEYIIHLDSDDWVDLQWLEDMYSTAVKSDADVVICDYTTVCSGKHSYVSQKIGVDKHETLNFLFSGQLDGFLWNKLVKKDMIFRNNYNIDDNINYLEDFCFVVKTLLLSNKTIHIPKSYIYYNKDNNNSITSNIDEKKILHVEMALSLIEKHLVSEGLYKKFCSNLNVFKLKQKLWFILSTEGHLPKKLLKLFPESKENICTLNRNLIYKAMLYVSYFGYPSPVFFIKRLERTLINIRKAWRKV
ncbi:glycosyltransferase family 2 protein [Vibrio fluvialis]|nr:glycosyltransferase family 2 protein [Vibrio fluvialis]MBY7774585.1 glycosyltransferase family 2 protein [Vibrio fluvialis]MBY7778777.1 glycosyltransferase family 2 protein [Vibrio fluvialis]MBY7988195.1 glycosyltransferase family 2 protein [Vibrio fluvialis]MBY7993775.1 glycosyltransferase family 2 protein [Vibrio fluvialis]